MDRVRAIEGSLRCFTCGCLSFIPLVGLAGGAMAIAEFLLVKRGLSGEWNPARKYLRLGLVLAIFGLLFNSIPFFFLSVKLLEGIAEGRVPLFKLFL